MKHGECYVTLKSFFCAAVISLHMEASCVWKCSVLPVVRIFFFIDDTATLKTDATSPSSDVCKMFLKQNKSAKSKRKKKKNTLLLHRVCYLISKWTKNTMHTNRCQVSGLMHKSDKTMKRKKTRRKNNKEIHNIEQIKISHAHTRTHTHRNTYKNA